MSYALSGGVHSGTGLVKAILAGASAVEVCSVIYQNGEKVIEPMKKELADWMEKNGYENLKNELKSSEQYQKAKKLLDEKGAQYKEKALNLKKEFLR